MDDPNIDTLLADNKALHDELNSIKEQLKKKDIDIDAVVEMNKKLLNSRNNPTDNKFEDNDEEIKKAHKALEDYINK